MHAPPSYLGVFLTFARNSLVRDMTFRANFVIEAISSVSWMIMNLGFYTIVYKKTPHIEGWDKYEFFVFIGDMPLYESYSSPEIAMQAAEMYLKGLARRLYFLLTDADLRAEKGGPHENTNQGTTD